MTNGPIKPPAWWQPDLHRETTGKFHWAVRPLGTEWTCRCTVYSTIYELTANQRTEVAETGQLAIHIVTDNTTPTEVTLFPFHDICTHQFWEVENEDLPEVFWTVRCIECGRAGLPHPEQPPSQ